MKATLRENLIATMALRAGYMDSVNMISLPDGVAGEELVADFCANAAREYESNNVDEPYDLYIERVLIERFQKVEMDEKTIPEGKTNMEKDILIQNMKPEERLYTYTQSQQISGQTGCIGHLRADMDSDGNGFYSSWDDHRGDLKTQEFKDEFDQVINYLRENSFLQNRRELSKYCYAHPESSYGNDREWGVRVNTQAYAYLMRLNPNKGEYNLYCYCYQKEWLDHHIHEAKRGIRFITPNYQEKFRIPDGDMVRLTYSDGETQDRIARYIDDYHVELGGGVGSNIYHICELAERLEQNGTKIIPLRSSLPEQCYVYLPTEHVIGIVKKGEEGYFRTYIYAPETKEEAEKHVDKANAARHITKAQARAMSAGSMFGWDCKAADPASYNEMGELQKPQQVDRGEAR